MREHGKGTIYAMDQVRFMQVESGLLYFSPCGTIPLASFTLATGVFKGSEISYQGETSIKQTFIFFFSSKLSISKFNCPGTVGYSCQIRSLDQKWEIQEV